MAKKDPVINKIYNTSVFKENWGIYCGEVISKYSRVSEYAKKDKILYINADNNSVMQEINFRKNEIIKKINDFFGEEVVKDLKFSRRC